MSGVLIKAWGAVSVAYAGGVPSISKQNGVADSVADTGVGVATITLDGGGIDESECYCTATPKGTGDAMCVVEHTSDTVKVVRVFDADGAALDADFDLLIFTYGSN